MKIEEVTNRELYKQFGGTKSAKKMIVETPNRIMMFRVLKNSLASEIHKAVLLERFWSLKRSIMSEKNFMQKYSIKKSRLVECKEGT